MKDTENGYGGVSILLHWLAAITMIALFVLGQAAEDATDSDRKALLGLHISIAISMYLILVGRIGWRLFNGRPRVLIQQSKPLMLLAHWIPIILLAGLALMLLSGPIMVWSKGYPINIFGLISLPSPLGKMETLHEVMEALHKLGAKLLFFAFALHMLGVLKHLIIDRDNTLKRMLVPSKKFSEK
jgi:cytochrome b561